MKSELLRICMKKGFLLDREMLALFSQLDFDRATQIIDILSSLQLGERVVTKRLFSEHLERISRALVRYGQIDEVSGFFELFSPSDVSFAGMSAKSSISTTQESNSIQILSSVGSNEPSPIDVSSFVDHFRDRFGRLQKRLETKQLKNLTSIRRILGSRGNYTVIGCVLEKKITKNKNILLTIEDFTGIVDVIIQRSSESLFTLAEHIVLDDVLAFEVSSSSNLLFARNIIFPETESKSFSGISSDSWVVFLSDLHFGSSSFCEEQFLRFIQWINGGFGDDEHRSIALKVTTVCILGDLVDSSISDGGKLTKKNDTLVSRYQSFFEMLSLIRDDINIILSPGDSDCVWRGEPQGELSTVIVSSIPDRFTFVSNPSFIDFEGKVRIGLYYGTGLRSYLDQISSLRINYSFSDLMSEVFRHGHLAPSHGLVDYLPLRHDSLVLDNDIDIFAVGSEYEINVCYINNTLCLSTSSWSKSSINEDSSNLCKIQLVNLADRKLKVLDFFDPSITWDSSDDLSCSLPSESFNQSKQKGNEL